MLNFLIALLQKLQSKQSKPESTSSKISPILIMLILGFLGVLVFEINILWGAIVDSSKYGWRYFGIIVFQILGFVTVFRQKGLIPVGQDISHSLYLVYIPFIIVTSHFFFGLEIGNSRYQTNIFNFDIDYILSLLLGLISNIWFKILYILVLGYPIISIFQTTFPRIKSITFLEKIKSWFVVYNIGYFFILSVSVSIFVFTNTSVWTEWINNGWRGLLVAAALLFYFTYPLISLKEYYSLYGYKRLGVLRGVLALFIPYFCIGIIPSYISKILNNQIARSQQIMEKGGDNYDTYQDAHTWFLDYAYRTRFDDSRNTNDQYFQKLYDAIPETYFGDKLKNIDLLSQSSAGTNATKVGKNASVLLKLAEIENTISSTTDGVDIMETIYKFHMTNDSTTNQEVIMNFQTPSQYSVVSDLKLGLNGELQGIVASRGAAQKVYNDSLRVNRDPALIEKVGINTYSLRVFPILPKTDTTTQGRQLVQFTVLTPLQKKVPIVYSPQVKFVNLKTNENTSLLSKIYKEKKLAYEDRVSNSDIDEYLENDHVLPKEIIDGVAEKNIADLCYNPLVVSPTSIVSTGLNHTLGTVFTSSVSAQTIVPMNVRNRPMITKSLLSYTVNPTVPTVIFDGKIEPHFYDIQTKSWMEMGGFEKSEMRFYYQNEGEVVTHLSLCKMIYPQTTIARLYGSVNASSYGSSNIVSVYECVQPKQTPFVSNTPINKVNNHVLPSTALPLVGVSNDELKQLFQNSIREKSKINIFFDNSLSAKNNNIQEQYNKIYDSIKNYDNSLQDVDIFSFNFSVEKLVKTEDIKFWGYTNIDGLVDYIEKNNITNEKIILVTDDDSFNFTTIENKQRDFSKILTNQIDVIKIGDAIKTYKSDFNSMISASKGTIHNLSAGHSLDIILQNIFAKDSKSSLSICGEGNAGPKDIDVQKIIAGYVSNVLLGAVKNSSDRIRVANEQNKIASHYQIVNQFNSMIALETEQQKNALHSYEQQEGKYDTIYNNMGGGQSQNQPLRLGQSFNTFTTNNVFERTSSPSSNARYNMGVDVVGGDVGFYGGSYNRGYRGSVNANIFTIIMIALIYVIQLYQVFMLLYMVWTGKSTLVFQSSQSNDSPTTTIKIPKHMLFYIIIGLLIIIGVILYYKTQDPLIVQPYYNMRAPNIRDYSYPDLR